VPFIFLIALFCG